MPKITELHLIEITPEKFLEACSPVELYEIEHLISSPRFQARMERDDRPAPAGYEQMNLDISREDAWPFDEEN